LIGIVLASILFIIAGYVLGSSRVRPLAISETTYVDTSGVANNPPQFIEVLKNKTINFKLDKWTIRIAHLSVLNGVDKIKRIATLFKHIQELHAQEPVNRMHELKSKALRYAAYNVTVKEMYNLAKPFAPGRRFKQAFYRKAQADIEWFLLIVEQVFDYWVYVGKLLSLLGQGGTLRQTIGGSCTWNSSSWDMEGRVIIKPRFVSCMN